MNDTVVLFPTIGVCRDSISSRLIPFFDDF